MKKYLYRAVLVVTVLLGVFLAYSIWNAPPRTSEHFLNSGKTYYEEKEYSKAIVEFLNALQKDARNRDARYLLAECYLAQRNFNDAVKQLNALLEYYPDDVQASLQLGNIYLAGGRTDSRF